MSDSPNYLRSAWSMFTAMRAQRPNPTGTATFDHSAFASPLKQLQENGLSGIIAERDRLGEYVHSMESIDPNTLSHDEALAFWVNLYNAESLLLVSEAKQANLSSVLRTPGVFHAKRVRVAGEHLSLDGVEHAKVRRFKDPRIHAALVCGSVSCPTLRSEPFTGTDLDAQLDDQMRIFLASGGIQVSADGTQVALSKVFQLYGGEFVRPQDMPTLKQAKKWEILEALQPWIDDSVHLDERPALTFQEYDWSLACTIK